MTHVFNLLYLICFIGLSDLCAATGQDGLTNKQINALKGKEYLNKAEILQQISWDTAQQAIDPYPSTLDPYDVVINKDVDCYVFFFDKFDKSSYKMFSLTEEEANNTGLNSNDGICSHGTAISGEIPACEGLSGENYTDCFEQECNKTEIRKSHLFQCGACSNLDDLFVYLSVTDLTTPVRTCGLLGIVGQDILECLLDIGFSTACAQIWRWNVVNTARLDEDGGCFAVCVAYNVAPNIEVQEDPTWGSPCEPETECYTTINGNQTCPDEIWQSGSDFRLNACLQCDECRSGPLFQQIAARTRRNSGIVSAIDRPDDDLCTDCYHDYGLPAGEPTEDPTSSPTVQDVNYDVYIIVASVIAVVGIAVLVLVVVLRPRSLRYNLSRTVAVEPK